MGSVRFSITIRQSPATRRLIEAIPDDAWSPIPYWIDGGADVAETTYVPFKDEPQRGHSVRRELRLRRALQDLLDAPGVIPVIVGQPDPLQLRQRHDGVDGVDEFRGVDAETGIDQHVPRIAARTR